MARGPVRGKIHRYDAPRRALYPEFEAILVRDNCSEQQAAKELNGALPGRPKTSAAGKQEGFIRQWREERRDAWRQERANGSASMSPEITPYVENIINRAVKAEVQRRLSEEPQHLDGGEF
jgi:hypothetical protein